MPLIPQIPLTTAALAGLSWLMLDVVGRRCRSGSLARTLLMSGRLSIAVTVLVAGLAWWIASLAAPQLLQLERDGREVRDGLVTLGVVWTLMRWRGELERGAPSYARQLLPHLAPKDQLFAVDVLGKLLSTTAALLVLLLVLNLLGVSAGVLITAGGFGAAAVGFGARTIVENGLSGVSLYINRPFTLGDTINLPGLNLLGTVEAVGWFYTELRDPDRQRIYVPNGVFSSQAVQNVAQIDNRRIWIEFGLRYDDLPRIATITRELQQRLDTVPGIDRDKERQVHFVDYADSSLNLRLLCYAASGAIEDAWALRQRVLLLIGSVVDEAGAAMPFPTRTVLTANPLTPAPGAVDRP